MVDVMKKDEVKVFVKVVIDVYGCIDVFVNNVGFMLFVLFDEMKVDEWD